MQQIIRFIRSELVAPVVAGSLQPADEGALEQDTAQLLKLQGHV